MERFYLKYDELTSILTIEVTDKTAFGFIKMFREHLPIEMMRSKMETVDVITDDGNEYKDVRRYTTVVAKDKVDVFFHAAKTMYTNSVIKSIPNSDN